MHKLSKQLPQIGPTAIVLLIALLIYSTACTEPSPDSTVAQAKNDIVAEAKSSTESMTVDELVSKLENNENIVILDCRSETEYELGHLQYSRNVPRGKLEFIAAFGKLGDTDATYVIYCRIDGRGALAAATMTRMGYTDVKYLSGGFKAWVESGHSIYNTHGELKVLNFEKKETEETQNE